MKSIVVFCGSSEGKDPAIIAEHAPLVFDTKNVMGVREFRGELL